MEQTTTIDMQIADKSHTVRVVRSSRRKKSVSLQYREGGLIVRAPRATSRKFIMRFLKTKQARIDTVIKKHNAYTKHKWFDPEQWTVMYFWASVSRDQWHIVLPFPIAENEADTGLKRAYRNYAKCYLTERTYALVDAKQSLVAKESQSLWRSIQRMISGRSFAVDTVRIWTYRRKYWQCKGREISYDWRIIAFPQEIIDHIILHELTHLIHRNHKPVFWNLLAKLDPYTDKHRQWLRDHWGRIHC